MKKLTWIEECYHLFENTFWISPFYLLLNHYFYLRGSSIHNVCRWWSLFLALISCSFRAINEPNLGGFLLSSSSLFKKLNESSWTLNEPQIYCTNLAFSKRVGFKPGLSEPSLFDLKPCSFNFINIKKRKIQLNARVGLTQAEPKRVGHYTVRAPLG